jgi:uncharacterized protein (TIGR04255 family)
MATPGRLANPPIREALVDLRIAGATTIDATVLEPLREGFRSRYPKAEPWHQMPASFSAEPGKAPSIETGQPRFHGLFLKSEDDSRLVQFRTDGFTLNQVAGYTSADDLFSEALPLWQAYASAVRATATVRVALRYINRLLLPFRHGDDFARFLTAPATMPAEAPQQVAEFQTRAVAQVDTPIEAAAIITQRLEHATGESTPFTLDIDVFKNGDFSVEPRSLEPILQHLREIKNRLFFAFLMDEALEQYR